MSVSVSTADLEAYLRRVRARLDEARAASSMLTTEVLNHQLKPGSFSAAGQFADSSVQRAEEYDERLRDYVASLESLEEAVLSIIANWEDADGATEAHLGGFDAALGDTRSSTRYDGELA
jgi:hypothetical protein